MKHGHFEFPDIDATRASACLAPGATFGKSVRMREGKFTLKRGTDQRGSRVRISFGEDAEIGGMVLRIVAEGYQASARSRRRDGASQWPIACSRRPGRRERRPVRAAA